MPNQPQSISEQFQDASVSVSEMLVLVKQTAFKISEVVDTDKSSWIDSASYYSCDGNKGYFILSTSKRNYIYRDVPLNLWEQFKQASSYGRFYNSNIKGRYEY